MNSLNIKKIVAASLFVVLLLSLSGSAAIVKTTSNISLVQKSALKVNDVVKDNIKGLSSKGVLEKCKKIPFISRPVTPLGDTIIVDDDGGGDYTSIQDAIDNASVGDVIVVKDGSYGDQLTVDVSVKIMAASGETPTIYVSTYDVGINVTAPDVLIEGFEIYGNGSLTGGPYPTIRASSGSDGLIINNNQFKVLTGQKGQVALLVAANVKNVTFTSNSVDNYNIGVLLRDHSEATISGNSFSSTSHDIYHAANIGGTNNFYGTIQDAISDASDGGVVNVWPGIYLENVLVNKPLSLRGAMAGFNPVNGRAGSESIVDGVTSHAITIGTGVENVTIDGFTVTISSKPSNAQGAGILIGKNTKNIEIVNNIIENITDGGGTDTISDETYGIMVYGRDQTGGQSNLVIRNNLIKNVEEYGIAINDKTSDVTIQGNLITDLIPSSHNDLPDPSWPSWFCAAIHLGGQVGPIKNVTIDTNTLSTNVTGNGNTSAAGGGVSFAGVAEWTNLSRIWEGFENITITNNRIYGNTMGIVALVGNFTNAPEIHSNNISGNTRYGINNTLGNIDFNATNNWWGNITGPFHPTKNPGGIGDRVSDNVTFWPWYEFDGYSIPPSVEVIVGYPNAMDGWYVTDKTLFEIRAQDNESGMYSLRYRVWDSKDRWSEWYNYTHTFNLSGEGRHLIQYEAIDKSGTKAVGTSEHYVDITGPWVEVVYPNGGEHLSGSVDIRWKAADIYFDQYQEKWNSQIVLPGNYPGHVQSFVPTEDHMNSIRLLLHGDDANITIHIFSELYPVPVSIGTVTKHVHDIGFINHPEWVDFPIDSNISLDVNKTYYIGVTQEIYGDTGFYWYYFNSTNTTDPYLYGHAYLRKTDQLESKPNWDWAFKIGYFNDVDVTVNIEVSMNKGVNWAPLAYGEYNDGVYTWDTTLYPDGSEYLIRIWCEDYLENMGIDRSDNLFSVDNVGPRVSNIVIRDLTIGSTEYTKDGDDLEITATVTGNPATIEADLSNFGKGSSVAPGSYTNGTATWFVSNITCTPPDGVVTIRVKAVDATGDFDEEVGMITADNSGPTVEITRPLPGVYLWDSVRILPYNYPLIIGPITIVANATDAGSGVEKVEFYVTDVTPVLKYNDTSYPYEYLWDEVATGFYTLTVKAYDKLGHVTSSKELDVFIINFDIL